jgi:hypothetical protein
MVFCAEVYIVNINAGMDFRFMIADFRFKTG